MIVLKLHDTSFVTIIYTGAITLTPSAISACPTETVTLSCSSTENTITSHGWSINVPGCDQFTPVIRADGTESISRLASGGQDCISGIEFHISRVSVSPFVSNLTTTTALDGTTIQCLGGGFMSATVRITIAGIQLAAVPYSI